MIRICVGNLKGGAGKTTTAVLLVLALLLLLRQHLRPGAPSPRLLLVDADPEQPQATEWARQAGDRWPDAVTVLHVPGRDLAAALDRHLRTLAPEPGRSQPYDAIVLDVGPKNPDLLFQAIGQTTPRRRDDGPGRLIIPTRPTAGDLRELPKVLGIAAEVDRAQPGWSAGIVAQVLLTQVRTSPRPNTGAGAEARQWLAAQRPAGATEPEADQDVTGAESEGIPVMTAQVRLLRRFELVFGSAPATAGELAEYFDVAAEVTGLGSAA